VGTIAVCQLPMVLLQLLQGDEQLNKLLNTVVAGAR
jgi:hypothetical protein